MQWISSGCPAFLVLRWCWLLQCPLGIDTSCHLQLHLRTHFQAIAVGMQQRYGGVGGDEWSIIPLPNRLLLVSLFVRLFGGCLLRRRLTIPLQMTLLPTITTFRISPFFSITFLLFCWPAVLAYFLIRFPPTSVHCLAHVKLVYKAWTLKP